MKKNCSETEYNKANNSYDFADTARHLTFNNLNVVAIGQLGFSKGE